MAYGLCYQVGFYAAVIRRRKDTTVQNAEKISITMTPDMLRAIRESVEAGEYASTREALRDAVRVWQRQRLEDAIAEADLDLAALDDEQFLSDIAFFENNLAGFVVARGSARSRQ